MGRRDGLRKDWLRRDKLVAHKVRHILRGAVTVDAVQNVASDRWDVYDLGFGASRIKAVAYGGYHSAWFTLVALGNFVVRGTMVAAPGVAVPPDVVQRIRVMWQDMALVSDTAIAKAEWEDSNFRRSMDHARWTTLGRPPDTPVPANVRAEYTLLTALMEFLVVGNTFGVSGQPPPGCEEARTIAALGDPNLLIGILRGPNPEGRIYACHHLETRYGNSLSHDVLATLSRVKTMPINVGYASGSDLLFGTAVDALRALGR